jgi:hypothetical protein
MKADIDIKLRRLASVDLDAANAVVEAAIMTWDLPERVKRLSLASYRYNVHDLEHLTIMGALDAAEAIVGVAAWEPASAADTPDGADWRRIRPVATVVGGRVRRVREKGENR